MGVKAVENICYVCEADVVLRFIKTDIVKTQIQLVTLWKASPESKAYDDISSDVVGNTVIPTYNEYNSIWGRIMNVSPLIYSWYSFDIHDSFDREYIIDVYHALCEQTLMWGVDSYTKNHDLFELIEIFLTKIHRLKNHTFINGI